MHVNTRNTSWSTSQTVDYLCCNLPINKVFGPACREELVNRKYTNVQSTKKQSFWIRSITTGFIARLLTFLSIVNFNKFFKTVEDIFLFCCSDQSKLTRPIKIDRAKRMLLKPLRSDFSLVLYNKNALVWMDTAGHVTQ